MNHSVSTADRHYDFDQLAESVKASLEMDMEYESTQPIGLASNPGPSDPMRTLGLSTSMNQSVSTADRPNNFDQLAKSVKASSEIDIEYKINPPSSQADGLASNPGATEPIRRLRSKNVK